MYEFRYSYNIPLLGNILYENRPESKLESKPKFFENVLILKSKNNNKKI